MAKQTKLSKITLRGAQFHGFEFHIGPGRGEGAPIIVASFTAPWTEGNREAGGWDELPESVSGTVNLVPADLAASHIEFKPKGLEQHALSMDVSSANHFQCFVPTKDGESRELRFKVKTPAIKAGREFDAFGRTVGDAAGLLSISYDASKEEEPPLISAAQAADTAKDD